VGGLVLYADFSGKGGIIIPGYILFKIYFSQMKSEYLRFTSQPSGEVLIIY